MKEKLEAKLVDMWISTRNKKKNFSFCWGKLFHKAGIFFIRFSSFSFLQSFNIEATTKMNFTLGNHCAKNFHSAFLYENEQSYFGIKENFPLGKWNLFPTFLCHSPWKLSRKTFRETIFLTSFVCLLCIVELLRWRAGLGSTGVKWGRKDFNGASNKCSGSS